VRGEECEEEGTTIERPFCAVHASLVFFFLLSYAFLLRSFVQKQFNPFFGSSFSRAFGRGHGAL
jgi:hypothetical protein